MCVHSLVADERGGVDLLDQGVIVAAHPSTHGVLAGQAHVVVALLHHKVHRRARVQVLTHVLKVLQHVRVLGRGRRQGGGGGGVRRS